MNSDIRVGPYRILRLINRGGQGSVYLGYDGRLRRRVAIKIYRLPERPAARRALFREAQTVASLDSPRIVSVYDIIESPGHLALVMEYVPGCDLREFLASVRPSLASVVTIATDLAAALAVARQQRLVHGDLKAANVLITDGGRAKLTDFGIARKGTESKVAGSLSALSPEQYLGEPLDVRSDLFALGCLVYRMLGGEEPFRKSGQLDVRWLLERPPPPLGELVPPEMDVPRELLELVMQMLRRDPGERPANTHRVRRVLREVNRDLPLSQGNSLLREARPCFRPESPEDIPPAVPAALGRGSRSRMVRGGLWSSLALWSWRRRLLALLFSLGLVVTPVVIALQDRETLVHIEAPAVDLQESGELPAQISSTWLVEQVKTVLRQRLGTIRVTGPVGATPVTVFYAGGDNAGEAPDERFALQLRCMREICAFTISRERRGELHYQHAVLLTGMPTQQWEGIVRDATGKLYE